MNRNKAKKYINWLIITWVIAISINSCGQKNASPKHKIQRAAQKALDAMGDLQRNGGWAMAWTEDGSATYGEWLLREDDIITVQQPATPGIGNSYLKAFKVLGDSTYLKKAVEAGDAMIAGQLDNGGFTHEFYPGKAKQDSAWFQHYGPNGEAWFPPDIEGADIYMKKRAGTFDDATTQYAVQYFLKLWETTGLERFKKAAEKGAQFMLDAQYPNGGWPQEYPLQNDYTRFITLNDDAMMDVMRTLFICTKALHDSSYYKAAIHGAHCLLDLQGNPPQAGWAQQYTEGGKPAAARPWEPPALSSRESVNVIKVLEEVYLLTGDRKYLEAGQRALDWLEHSKLKHGTWSRYYEIGTNKPVYGGPHGKITYDLNVALQYHAGYSWSGHYLNPRLIEEYKKLLNAPVEKRKEVKKEMAGQEPLQEIRKKALAAVASLDNRGFWTKKMKGETLKFYRKKFGNSATPPDLIASGTFTDNINTLLNYLKRTN